MEDETGGLLFSSNVNNVSQQFSISTVSIPPLSSDHERSENKIDTVNDLLENGILVETNKGLVCLSLKDVLTTGVGGLNLSVEDFQNVAAQLLTQQSVDKPVLYKQVDVDNGNIESSNSTSLLQQQIGLIDGSLRPIEKDEVKKINGVITSKLPARREQTEPVLAVAPPTPAVPEPPSNAKQTVVNSSQQQKKRGGWPKGRKRKPELSELRPPKAPATGYVLYLNEKRKQYKDLPFAEVTKLLGNEWSKLSLDDKRIYLERADVEKKRYREELKAYRDFTKERLAAEQEGNHSNGSHSMSTSLDESSLETTPTGRSGGKGTGKNKQESCSGDGPSNVTDAILRFMETTSEREREIRLLNRRMEDMKAKNAKLMEELCELKERETRLLEDLECEKEVEGMMDQQVYNLLSIPTMFYINNEIEQNFNDNIPIYVFMTEGS
ncbi:hypothetical protein C0J52_14722 [Blattella germanica]|nr:hypothetical protein C0J52_14722 [Blattella germanica]